MSMMQMWVYMKFHTIGNLNSAVYLVFRFKMAVGILIWGLACYFITSGFSLVCCFQRKICLPLLYWYLIIMWKVPFFYLKLVVLYFHFAGSIHFSLTVVEVVINRSPLQVLDRQSWLIYFPMCRAKKTPFISYEIQLTSVQGLIPKLQLIHCLQIRNIKQLL